MKVTFINIAKKANVSLSTVSRVLSGNGYASASTSKKVHDAAKSLQYTPNYVAKTLRKQESSFIGVIIKYYSHPFFSSLCELLAKKLTSRDTEIVTVCSYNDKKEERRIIENMKDHFINRIVFLGACGVENIQYALNTNMRCVAIERSLGNTEINKIIFDYYTAGVMAFEKLLAYNHTDIGFIGLDPKAKISEKEKGDILRYKGCMDTAKKYALRTNKHCIALLPNYEIQPAYQSILNMFKRNTPSALVVTNATHLIGVLQALYTLNIRIPDDISIISMMDFYSNILSPRISCISYAFDIMGDFVMDIFFSPKQKVRQSIILPAYYVNKDSVSYYKV